MKTKKIVTFLIVAAALLVLPLILQQGGNAWVRIGDMALRMALVALGRNLVGGSAGLLALGYVVSLPSVPTCLRCWARRTWPMPFPQ